MSSLVALWAVPRSRSTAFERMMSARGDITVVHEPFSYLVIEGWFTVDGTTATTMPELLNLLLTKAANGRLFVKDTVDYSYASLLAQPRFYHDVEHTFLIRDPARVVASYHAMKPEMERDEVGFHRLCEMFQRVQAATGRVPVVIDAEDLVRCPAAVVSAFCAAVGLPYLEQALCWSASASPQWGPTADWHRDAGTSTGFADAGNVYPTRPEHADVVAFHRPFYERMYAHRLQIGDGGSDAPGR